MSVGSALRLLPAVPAPCRISDEDVLLLAHARHPAPQSVLGPQLIADHVVVRCWVSGAEAIYLISTALFPCEDPDATEEARSRVPVQRVDRCPSECPWLFEVAFALETKPDGKPVLDATQLRASWFYELHIKYGDGGSTTVADPYSLSSLLPASFLADWTAGNLHQSPASMFGAHHMELRPSLWGARFAVWAPHAHAVSVVGDFNFWDGRAHPMCSRTGHGVWELFLPWDLRGQKYGYQISRTEGAPVVKTDPFAMEFVEPVNGAHDAKVPQFDDYSRQLWSGAYPWKDADWLQYRADAFGMERWAQQPLSIYEVHLGSWAAGPDGDVRGYRELAEPLAAYVKSLGFVAVEFLPLSQYPCDKSWGYQCASGLYAVDSRLGTPDDLKHLIDTLHQHSIFVIMDIVLAHFAKDEWGLVQFSGQQQFEYAGALGEIPGWGTARFDYSKPEVRAYLVGAADFWIDQMHVDGLRLDAVAAMLYTNFGREEDGDAILAGNGLINPDGVSFVRELCTRVKTHPGVLIMAEESTNYKWVTSRPSEKGTERHDVRAEDLGFHLKWNMGFTYDTLAFLGAKSETRCGLEVFGWQKLAWYLAYAFNERWVLPLSHDNAHQYGWLDQMTNPADAETKSQFAHLRLLMAYIVGMPGRPLIFMGAETGEGPWSYEQPSEWKNVDADPQKLHLKRWVTKMLVLYRELPALHRQDDEASGFIWIDKDSSKRCVYAWKRSATDAPDVIVVVNFGTSHIPVYGLPAGGSSTSAWRRVAITSLDESPDAVDDPQALTRATPDVTEFTIEVPAFSAQIWLACDTCDSPLPAVDAEGRLLCFEVRHEHTLPGEVVHVVGDCPELGSWQASDGVPLSTNAEDFPKWHAAVRMVGAYKSVEYKLVVAKRDGSFCWEELQANRHLQLERNSDAQQYVRVQFGLA